MIVVHDAARPLISEDVIERVIAALGEGFDGAVPGLPLADTVKRVRDGVVVETVPRDELVTVQTPQAFVAPVLRAALDGLVLSQHKVQRTARRSSRRTVGASRSSRATRSCSR